MIFTLNWLKEHLDTQASLKEICDSLDSIGLEIEDVKDRADALKAFTVAEIIEANPHPDADKLQICQVQTHEGMQEIVCGAPNARAGIKVVFGGVGVAVPGITGDDGKAFILKKAKIRGVESAGMMLSRRELGLGDEHTGIVELPANANVGEAVAAYLGVDDPIIEVAITPNRGDWLGIRSIARELAAAGLGTLKPLNIPQIQGSFASPKKVVYGDDTAKLACPWFVGRMVKNVKNTESPQWLKDRLEAIGLRPISALVDITNYLTIDLCRPAHFFDAAKLNGNVVVRMAKEGESIEALDEKNYKLDNNMLTICDEQKPHGIAGIMGGEESGCSDETAEIFMEIALFDPISVATTGRKLSLQSDARYRFERGVDRAFLEDAMQIATQMVLDICGGEASEIISVGAPLAEQAPILYHPERTQSLAGIEIGVDKQVRILEALGFTVKQQGENYSVQEPSWRWDHEGEAGIVEEVVRIYGLDNIEPISLAPEKGLITQAAENPTQRKRERARQLLAARGCWDTVTFSFMDSRKAAMFTPLKDNLFVANPVSSEMDYMRPSLLPNLLDGAVYNMKRGFGDVDLFEIGPIFEDDKADSQPIVVAALRVGQNHGRHWLDKPRNVDVFDAKADALAVLDIMDAPVDNLMTSRNAPGYYHPGRSGSLSLGPKNILAYFGELHPSVAKKFGIKGTAVAIEIFPHNIPESKKKQVSKGVYNPSDLMPLSRDFAFTVASDVDAEKLRRAAFSADKKLITAAEIFDVFEGGNLGEGQKSVALNIKIQPTDKTLTDAELEALQNKVIQAVEKQGALLRS
ncbi:MAG: phenylalanine--tRNA ligase subunit beta [Alphaproteobacteria bacterium]